MQDLGLKFKGKIVNRNMHILELMTFAFPGREHSGIEDARNTSQLAVKMMIDGCDIVITKFAKDCPKMHAKLKEQQLKFVTSSVRVKP